jgi:hypothetical protein
MYLGDVHPLLVELARIRFIFPDPPTVPPADEPTIEGISEPPRYSIDMPHLSDTTSPEQYMSCH